MKRSHPYINASATKDSSEPTHMSCEQLEASLTEIGIKVPTNLPKIVLRKLLIENMNTACDFNSCVTVSCKLLKHCVTDVSAPNMVFMSLLPLKLAAELLWSSALAY
jgi:hypothetical protein